MSCKHNRLKYVDGVPFCKDCCSNVHIEGEINVTFLTSYHNIEGHLDEMSYYGITNPVTGEGITKDTDVREPIGVSASIHSKKEI